MWYRFELAEMERAYAQTLRSRQDARRRQLDEARTTSRKRGSAAATRTAVLAARRGVAWFGSALVSGRGLRGIARRAAA